ncbi:hypothetical protein [Cytobacillus gottheilii]|uniref:hypothetical protein n=1 Tax=Cytobacillus gottheilii TaxID=859144 RepID=UPI002494E2A3|nr:hypothetical protein [Cytobacillus gottheilii]
MNAQPRRSLLKISMFGISYLKDHNPYMIAWWSAVFPGFGHYLLNQYIRATLLTLSEVIINTLAHINEAMIYSFCGKYELATSILEPTWAFGYLVIYLYTIGDSFRIALYQNKLTHLALKENKNIPCLAVTAAEIQYLEEKSPFFSAFYSFFFPGLGQLYNHRFGLAFYAMFWWWIYIWLSKAHEALLTLLLGQLEASNSMLNPHWFLFMPSVLFGSIYQSYLVTMEQNQLFRLEQRTYLSKRYSNSKLRIFS